MKEWYFTNNQIVRLPSEVLQEYADSLIVKTSGLLSGQVNQTIVYGKDDIQSLHYSFYVYLSNLKQSYKLFEVKQTTELVYPVDLMVFFYTAQEKFENIMSDKRLDEELAKLIASPGVSNLIGHFLRLSELKENE